MISLGKQTLKLNHFQISVFHVGYCLNTKHIASIGVMKLMPAKTINDKKLNAHIPEPNSGTTAKGLSITFAIDDRVITVFWK